MSRTKDSFINSPEAAVGLLFCASVGLHLLSTPGEAESAGLGEVYTYGSNPQPPPVNNPTSPYGTVSDDERATAGSQQPAREFSIWDSISKPVRGHTRRTANSHRVRQQKFQRQAAGVPPSNNAPPPSNNAAPPTVTAPPDNKPPNPGMSQTTLIIGAGLLVGAFFMARS